MGYMRYIFLKKKKYDVLCVVLCNIYSAEGIVTFYDIQYIYYLYIQKKIAKKITYEKVF